MSNKQEVYDVTLDKWRELKTTDLSGGGSASYGTAGTPSTSVGSVQGITGGTPISTRTAAAETTNTPTQVALTASTSATLNAATAARIRFVIYNPLATVLYVRKAASAASATAYDFVVPASGQYFSDPYEWAGELRGFCTTAGSVNFSESV